MKRAIIFGSTGLTGSKLLEQAAASEVYGAVICFNRKEVAAQFPKQKNIVTNFSDLSFYADLFQNADVFCCLGTTTKNVQGDKEKYREADIERPLLAAQAAVAHGASSFSVQTAMGADSKSTIFYNRFKGELEDRLTAMPLPALFIYRPSLLTGDRKEHRSGEKFAYAIMRVLDPLMIGFMRKYRSIAAADVAKAMLRVARSDKKGKHIFLSDAIQKLADGK